MNYRIFNVRTGSFLCMRIHMHQFMILKCFILCSNCRNAWNPDLKIVTCSLERCPKLSLPPQLFWSLWIFWKLSLLAASARIFQLSLEKLLCHFSHSLTDTTEVNSDQCFVLYCSILNLITFVWLTSPVGLCFRFLLARHKAAIDVYNEAAKLSERDWVRQM